MLLKLQEAPQTGRYVYTDHLGSRLVEIEYTESPRGPNSARGSWPVFFDPLKKMKLGVYHAEGTFTTIASQFTAGSHALICCSPPPPKGRRDEPGNR
jgi:hypothetical protein